MGRVPFCTSCKYRRFTSSLKLLTFNAWFAFMPIMARFSDHSPSWVRIPDKIAGMPHLVWKNPVTRPASIPASTAPSMASHTFQPESISMTQTAPPVQKEPSTVRSAMSSSW